MSVFSNQLFISPERPVDPFTLSILDLIDRLLRDAKIRYMLVGATARDLLLYHVFGHAVTRATYDLDFAILAGSWEQFAILKWRYAQIASNKKKPRYKPGLIAYAEASVFAAFLAAFLTFAQRAF
jgi:predicted nucleotidyltransferase